MNNHDLAEQVVRITEEIRREKVEDNCKPTKITISNDMEETATIRDMILAVGFNTGMDSWVSFKRCRDYLENMGCDSVFIIDENTFASILEDIESDGLIDVNWDFETYTTIY